MKRKFALSSIRTCTRNDRGTTAIEFAVIAPLFFLVLFAVLEFGLIGYSQVVLQAAVTDVSRSVSVGVNTPGLNRVSAFTSQIRSKVSGLPNGSSIRIASAVVGNGGAGGVTTPTPDVCLTSPPSYPPTCDAPTPFQDNNGNGRYDSVADSNNLGATGEIVEIKVTLPWDIKFPFLKSLFGDGSGVINLSASTILKNE